jgi:hypothetical protein
VGGVCAGSLYISNGIFYAADSLVDRVFQETLDTCGHLSNVTVRFPAFPSDRSVLVEEVQELQLDVLHNILKDHRVSELSLTNLLLATCAHLSSLSGLSTLCILRVAFDGHIFTHSGNFGFASPFETHVKEIPESLCSFSRSLTKLELSAAVDRFLTTLELGGRAEDRVFSPQLQELWLGGYCFRSDRTMQWIFSPRVTLHTLALTRCAILYYFDFLSRAYAIEHDLPLLREYSRRWRDWFREMPRELPGLNCFMFAPHE